jgi:hypothetical protein
MMNENLKNRDAAKDIPLENVNSTSPTRPELNKAE